MEVVLEKFVKYFRAVLHHNQGCHSASKNISRFSTVSNPCHVMSQLLWFVVYSYYLVLLVSTSYFKNLSQNYRAKNFIRAWFDQTGVLKKIRPFQPSNFKAIT